MTWYCNYFIGSVDIECSGNLGTLCPGTASNLDSSATVYSSTVHVVKIMCVHLFQVLSV